MIQVRAISSILWTFAFVISASVDNLPFSNTWFDIFWGYIFFCILAAGMPEPNENSSLSYRWCFKSFHMLAIIPVKIIHSRTGVE